MSRRTNRSGTVGSKLRNVLGATDCPSLMEWNFEVTDKLTKSIFHGDPLPFTLTHHCHHGLFPVHAVWREGSKVPTRVGSASQRNIITFKWYYSWMVLVNYRFEVVKKGWKLWLRVLVPQELRTSDDYPWSAINKEWDTTETMFWWVKKIS